MISFKLFPASTPFAVILVPTNNLTPMVMDTEKLKQEKEKFEALFQFASMGILVADAEARIILVNNF